MPAATGREALVLTIVDKLQQTALNSASLDVWSVNGRITVYYANAIPSLANLLADFYVANGRMPNVILNDGKPAEFASAVDGPLVRFAYRTYFYAPNAETGSSQQTTAGYPVFAVPVYGPNIGALPSRFLGDGAGYSETREIPLSDVEAGAFANWGLLMVAATNPQYVIASDYGFILKPQGVAMIERSLSYWVSNYITSRVGSNSWNDERASIDSIFGSGPAMAGVPFKLVDSFYQQYLQSVKDGSTTGFFKYMATIVMSFIAFAAGGAALGGLAGGAFTLSNIGSALSMASRFGVETGPLSLAIKALNLTNGNNLFSNPVNSSTVGGSMGDEWGDAFDALDDWNQQLDLDAVINANTGDNIFDGVDFSDAFDANADWGLALDETWNANIGGDWGDYGEWITNAGPVTGEQFASVTNPSAAVTQAAGLAMRAAGVPTNSATTSPAAIAQARAIAAQQAQSTTGATQSLWQQATQLLGMYSQYQLQSQQIQRGVPLTRSYPTASNPVVRQPDGSISVLNPDGTVRTVMPNGVQTGGIGSLLSQYLTPTNIAIGGALLGGAILLSNRSRN